MQMFMMHALDIVLLIIATLKNVTTLLKFQPLLVKHKFHK